MYLSKSFSFEAAHRLPLHPGKCRRLHGHSYGVTLGIAAPVHAETGMVVDLEVLSKLVRPITDVLDHRFLNIFLDTPTCERLVQYFGNLYRALHRPPLVSRVYVMVSETANTYAAWDSQEAADLAMTPVTFPFPAYNDFVRSEGVCVSKEEFLEAQELLCQASGEVFNMVSDVASTLAGRFPGLYEEWVKAAPKC